MFSAGAVAAKLITYESGLEANTWNVLSVL